MSTWGRTAQGITGDLCGARFHRSTSDRQDWPVRKRRGPADRSLAGSHSQCILVHTLNTCRCQVARIRWRPRVLAVILDDAPSAEWDPADVARPGPARPPELCQCWSRDPTPESITYYTLVSTHCSNKFTPSTGASAIFTHRTQITLFPGSFLIYLLFSTVKWSKEELFAFRNNFILIFLYFYTHLSKLKLE